jgi:F0F1-type ATP synthase assembly protein I
MALSTAVSMVGDRSSSGPRLIDLLTLGVTDAACLGAGFGVGWLLDGVVDSRPLLTLFGLVVGIVIAVLTTWSQMRKFLDSGER